ncbi:alcohol dehydrogenase [Capsaspora owczarzaki ATCC 30864]|uniref:alcohol dehydrogenase n=1 Tax=Capsaspora owczarzaki (strain ATCC 30864) TaxID=595528 RepID=UPI0001FE5366|nr:alcohol dehydrogenase [Capsaspora owczarzaki ATCC 30864]|eukprot:XP_004365764.1 alcohol dehydrogenase [Capsaspora owczarzaki ATCC 30864]
MARRLTSAELAGVATPTTTTTAKVLRMLFEGPGKPFVAQETANKEITLGAGEILVRLTMATVCGSDLHTASGRRAAYLPSVLGHEGVGVIEAVGADTTVFTADAAELNLATCASASAASEQQQQQAPNAMGNLVSLQAKTSVLANLVGRRVTWTLTNTCGHCLPCTEWHIPQKCTSLFKYGHAPLEDACGLNGCFASHILLRQGTAVILLPEDLSDNVAVPANCALSTMVAVVEKVPVDAKTVLIQGAGLLGVYGAALLKDRGVATVYVSDNIDSRLELAAEFGAVPVKGAEVAALKPQSVDAVIEVAGVASIIPEGIRLLRPAGTYVFAGMVHPETKLGITGLDVIKNCLTICGVHNYASHHLVDGIEFLRKTANRHPWSKLVSPPVPLTQLDQAFELSNQRQWHRVAVQLDQHF